VQSKVEKWMRTNVVLVEKDVSVMKAANAMLDKKIGSLIVIEEKKPVGIVTETDIVRKVVATGVSSRLITMGDIMTGKVLSLSKESTLTEASELMNKKRVKRLPVVEKDEVVGIITSTDIVGAMAKLDLE